MPTHRTHTEIIAELVRLGADLQHHMGNAIDTGEDAVYNADAAAHVNLLRAITAVSRAREAIEEDDDRQADHIAGEAHGNLAARGIL